MKLVERGGAPPGNRAGGRREEAAHTDDSGRNVRQYSEKVKMWERSLALSLDGMLEAETGDLGLIQRNLVEAATEMLAVAAEIRGELRQ
jgi:hypothetical protein